MARTVPPSVLSPSLATNSGRGAVDARRVRFSCPPGWHPNGLPSGGAPPRSLRVRPARAGGSPKPWVRGVEHNASASSSSSAVPARQRLHITARRSGAPPAAAAPDLGSEKAAGTGSAEDLGRAADDCECEGDYECGVASSGGTGEQGSCTPSLSACSRGADLFERSAAVGATSGATGTQTSTSLGAGFAHERSVVKAPPPPKACVEHAIVVVATGEGEQRQAVSTSSQASPAAGGGTSSTPGVPSPRAPRASRSAAVVDAESQTEDCCLPVLRRVSSKDSIRSPQSCLSGTSLDPRTWPMIGNTHFGMPPDQSPNLAKASTEREAELDRVRLADPDVAEGDVQARAFKEAISVVRAQCATLQQLCCDVRTTAVHEGALLHDEATAACLAEMHQRLEDCLSAAIPETSAKHGVLASRIRDISALRSENRTLVDKLVAMQCGTVPVAKETSGGSPERSQLRRGACSSMPELRPRSPCGGVQGVSSGGYEEQRVCSKSSVSSQRVLRSTQTTPQAPAMPMSVAMGRSHSERALPRIHLLSSCSQQDLSAGPLFARPWSQLQPQSRSPSPPPGSAGGASLVSSGAPMTPVVIRPAPRPHTASVRPSGYAHSGTPGPAHGSAGSSGAPFALRWPAPCVVHTPATFTPAAGGTLPVSALSRSPTSCPVLEGLTLGSSGSTSALVPPSYSGFASTGTPGSTSPCVPRLPIPRPAQVEVQPFASPTIPPLPPPVVLEVPSWQRSRCSSPPRMPPHMSPPSPASSAVAPSGCSSSVTAATNASQPRAASTGPRGTAEVIYRPARRYRMRWVIESEECLIADPVTPSISFTPVAAAPPVLSRPPWSGCAPPPPCGIGR